MLIYPAALAFLIVLLCPGGPVAMRIESLLTCVAAAVRIEIAHAEVSHGEK